jgi:hypothetical protein
LLVGALELVHFNALFLFEHNLLRSRTLPARHLRQIIAALFIHFKVGILGRRGDGSGMSLRRRRGWERLHGGLLLVTVVRRNIWLVEVLVLAATGGIAATAAVAAALEAAEAAATAGLGQAAATNDAGENRKKNQAADDYDNNNGPSRKHVSGGGRERRNGSEWSQGREGVGILAIGSLHTVVPAGKGSLDVADCVLCVADNVPSLQIGNEASDEDASDGLPSRGAQAPDHVGLDGRHVGGR